MFSSALKNTRVSCENTSMVCSSGSNQVSSNDSAILEAAVPCFSSQASSEIIFPESEYIFPGGELNLRVVGARSSDAL